MLTTQPIRIPNKSTLSMKLLFFVTSGGVPAFIAKLERSKHFQFLILHGIEPVLNRILMISLL